MQDHVLIGNFVGMHPLEKALVSWINSSWKPKGHYDLQLGSKGFFTISFLNMEHRNIILDGGPYLFYSVGLFLRPSKEKFYPEKENMKVALVWIRMYSLLCEYWDPKILEDLGNSLGKFIKISEHGKIQIYIAYTRICVYMDLTDLPEAIIMSWEDED